MHVLHERPWLDRDSIRDALSAGPLDVTILPAAFQALTQSDLADQVEAIKITPAPLGTDEMSKLWSAIQTHYRPSAAYQVSVVLIEATRPARTSLPVLSRGKVDPATQRDEGVLVTPGLLPPTPTLLRAESGNPLHTARLGETIKVTGSRLAGTGARARLLHRLLDTPFEVPVVPDAAGTAFDLALPNDAAAQENLPAGTWQLSLVVKPAGEPDERESNTIPLLISAAPAFVASGAPLNLPAPLLQRQMAQDRVRVKLASRPKVRPEQTASLMIGGMQATANHRTASGNPLVFDFPLALAAGIHHARLRVDGVDSELVIVPLNSAPVFDPAQRLSVPA
jgi:hypothetical protein